MRFGDRVPIQHLRVLSSLALIFSDLAAFLFVGVVVRSTPDVPRLLLLDIYTDPSRAIDIFALLSPLFIIIRYIAGDYTRRSLFWDRARSTSQTLILLSIPCFLVVALFRDRYSFSTEAISWGILLFAIPLARQSARIILDYAGLWRIPTAFVASIENYEDILTTIHNTLSLGCHIKWLATEKHSFTNINGQENLRLIQLNSPKDLAVQLAEEGCYQAFVVADDMRSAESSEITQCLMDMGLSVSFIPTYRRLPLAGASTSYFFGKDILLYQMRCKLLSLPSRTVKRTFDLTCSALVLMFCLPVFVIISYAIKRDDGGTILFSQSRVGRNGRKFQCLKFRTMAVDAPQKLEAWKELNPELYTEFQKTFKLIDDPRITKIGRWLRQTSLDEIPQLVNVLRGDMSLVGPRPVVERELIEYYGPAATNLYKKVRPGLTGLWQVRGRSNTSYEERVLFDEWYVLNWSFWYDIVIILETIWVVVLRKGAY